MKQASSEMESVENEIEQTEADAPKAKKMSLWEKLKKPFRFKVQLAVVPKNPASGESKNATSSDVREQDQAEPEGKKKKIKAKKEKKPKEKKEKKPKVKKEKKPKAKKEKKPRAKKAEKAANDEAGGKKRRIPMLAIIIAAAVVLVGAVVAGILLLRTPDTPESRLAKAVGAAEAGKYDKAIGIYNKLIEDELLVVDSYLGQAEAYVAMEDTESAIVKLKAGFEATGDTQLKDRLAELSPDSVPELVEPPPSDVVITFSDASFEKMIRMALDIPNGGNITQKDLDTVRNLKIYGNSHAVINETLPAFNTNDGYTIDGQLYTDRGTIKSLADIQYFRKMTKLSIGYNQINSLNGLEGAGSLEMLGLYSNQVRDISVLAQVKNLKWLYLYHNNIQDVSPLSGHTALRQLYLQYNNISDISPLAGLTQLQELSVDYNNISDISVVSKLTKLRFFSAKYNQISDISPVAEVDALTDVFFEGNPVADFSPAADMHNVSQPSVAAF